MAKQNPGLQVLRELGWTFLRNGKGRHQIWTHPDYPKSRVTVAVGGKVQEEMACVIRKQCLAQMTER